ncbi:ribonuclease E/G [Poseidonocella sedimentorum]|uniref:Ribonuclease, Rne/Rng family n=1 Tax=Poseidonocella sedimentorum TaxID=871652 RepID=A0A1I6CN90_9RHOB|nr:ribonuclease E/G [Poseidonocella sedimentorum]SFQ94637.1 ribonuclease, Rne/Rng family [Poseidonocella sedimentorum]
MKGRVIALDHLDGVEAAALMVDGRLEDLLVAGDRPAPGTIYRAIADRPVKGQGGMFFKTPDGSAFLRQVRGLSPGQSMLVQVTGYAEAGKAIPVTSKLLFKSRYAIVTPDAPGLNISRRIRDEERRVALLEIAHEEMDGRDYGLILRSSCAEASEDEIASDIRDMAGLAQQVLADAGGDGAVKLIEGDAPHLLAWREWTEPATIDADAGSFERSGALDEIELLGLASAPLPGGGQLFIEPTRALVAVDVNTGADASPAAGLKANLATAKELPRQLRLRGLGGQIVLDLAPMGKKDRRQMESALRGALKSDSVETIVVGWTPLGHLELQRKRERLPLSETRR